MPKKHTKNFNKLRAKVIHENALIENAIAEQVLRVEKLRALCKHDGKILKVPFKRGTFIDRHELRLCTLCGLQETGWNPQQLASGYGAECRDVSVQPEVLYQMRSILNGRG